MTITEFLTARLDEDEAVAREVQDEIRRQLEAGQYLPGHGPDPDEAGMYHGDGPMDHPSVIVGPARVLAEVAAKRAIVAWCSERDKVWIGGWSDDPADPLNYVDGEYSHPHDALVLRMLARAHADHPDYDEGWG